MQQGEGGLKMLNPSNVESQLSSDPLVSNQSFLVLSLGFSHCLFYFNLFLFKMTFRLFKVRFKVNPNFVLSNLMSVSGFSSAFNSQKGIQSVLLMAYMCFD